MKPFVLRLLIVCIFTISLHGFGANENMVIAASDEVQAQSLDLLSGTAGETPVPTLNAACDICQVVHQYLVVDQNPVSGKDFTTLDFSVLVTVPPDQLQTDILHPPTA
ncbi:hypothetical protein MNBD_ALPHA06-30 [hydrothermal vent metagenome]|uniref:DUF2946 domain-containing protein n=1 Tax=hydrothermal vent metagenome TaxID=652676 RepID=A0A3B0S3Y8_9ZZZZ